MRRAFLPLIALTLVLTACPSDSASAAPCATTKDGTTADGEAVVICEELYAERPYVRPPADRVQAGEPTILYAAALNSEYTGFVDRAGTRYRTVTPANDPIALDALPASLHAPSGRHLFLIYKIQGTVSPYTDDSDPPFTAGISIEEITPAIMLTGNAIDALFLGPWEGRVTKRAPESDCTIATPCWDPDDTVPIRVEFDALVPNDNIAALPPAEGTLADGVRFTLTGAVANMDRAVMGSDGTCFPSLASLGAARPFAPSTTGDLRLERFPAMHTPIDDALVLHYPVDTEGMGGANGMSPLNVLHPVNLLLTEADPAWTSIAIRNHGVPNGSEIALTPVTGGGGDC